MPYIRAVRKSADIPNNADCSWPTIVGCDWWRAFPDAGCIDDRLMLYSSGSPINSRVAITGWWTGFIGTACGGSDPYVTSYDDNSVYVRVFDSLNDGIWSSSASFGIYAGRKTIATSLQPNYTQWGGPPSGSWTVPATAVPVIGAACPSTLIGTVTIYDDGSVSIA